MRVSIITVTFNSATTIVDTLLSVQEQTYDDIEHIIIDGNSRDETENIVRKISPGAIWRSEPDEGLYHAMNKGLDLATGDVIGILNSDDFYPEMDIIEQVVRTMGSKHVDAVYGDLSYVSREDTKKIIRKWKSGMYRRHKFRFGWMPPHPAFFVRRKIYDKYGTFRTDLRSSADYELMLRFLYKQNVSVAYLPRCLVHMRAGGQSNASFLNRLHANREDRLAWSLNGLDMPFYTPILKPARKILQFI